MERKILHITFLYLCFFHFDCYSQVGKNWYFYVKNAIRFDAFPPTILTNCQMGNPPIATTNLTDCGTVSDLNGNLLFYNSGDSIYNRNNITMPNGFNLCTPNSTGHISFAIPFVSDSNRYYIFQSAKKNTTLPINYYNFHVVNMSLNGGLGDLEIKNDTIYLGSSDRLTAIKKANGIDYWIITHHQLGNTWRVFSVNCAGFNKNNFITSNIGTSYNNNDYLEEEGILKVSSNGKFLATNLTGRGYIELFEFNNSTGIVSNPLKIKGRFLRPRYCEFSPDSKQIYIYSDDPLFSNTGLDQYDISTYDSAIISNSRYSVLQSPPGINTGTQLQNAVDGRIYTGSQNGSSPALSVIANPNIRGVGCNFIQNVVTLSGTDFVNGLPYTVPSITTNPNVQISYTVAPDCRTVTFNAKTYIKGNNLTFKWKWGEPPPIAGTAADSATQVVPSGGDTTYTTITHTYPPVIDTFFVGLSVNSDTLCGTGRAGIRVVVKPPKPTANFGFSSTCNSLSVAFTDSSLLNFNPSLSYQYAVKPALALPAAYTNFSTAPNNTYTFGSYDSFDVRLIVRSPLSCVQADTIVKRIVLKAKPTAACSYTNNCGSLSVAFINGSSIAAGSISSYKYFVGNTLIASTPSFTYNFAAYGSYIIKQVLQSNFGCVSDTFFLPVVVKDKPIATLSFANDSVCANTNFTITSNAGVNAATVTNYFWQINGGAVQSSATNARIENLVAGVYNYKHWVRSSQGCESDTVFQTFTVVSKPTASIAATSVCGSKLVNFTVNNNVVNDVLNGFYINYGNGITFTNSSAPANYTYPNFGSYPIQYVVASSIGCLADTAFASVVVKDKPVVSSIGYSNNACSNKNFTLTSNSTVADASISNYYWQLNGGAVINVATNALTQNLPAGTYDIAHWVKSSKGCESDTVYKSITVDAFPQTNFTVQNTCVNKPVVFANNSTGNIALHTWELTPADVRTGTTSAYIPTYTYTGAGSFSIKLKTATPNGCADSITNPISIETIPTAAFSVTEACLGKIIMLQNTSSNISGAITNYSWQSGSQSSNAMVPDFIYNTVGDYNIGLNISTANGCTATTSQKVNIRAVQLFATADTSIAINQPLQLNISGAQNYTWLPATNLNNAAVPNPIFTTAQEGIYLLTSTGTTAQGCKGNEAVKITVYKTNTYLLLPNAFTPNGDGLNDYFKPLCAGLKELTNFTIYNRYGQVVFNQKGCGTSRGWDGKFKGALQNTGAFVYVWSGVDFRGAVVGGKGSVMVVR